jgi:hypothetical protein
MPTKPRREDRLITLFLSAYDDSKWAEATIDWLDRRQDGAVEAVARRSDGRTLAIEHTLVEFFTGERTDLERFKPFLRIESDESLSVPGKIIYVNVPRGVLDGLKQQEQDQIVNSCHDWLRANIRTLPSGDSMQTCRIEPCGDRSVVDLQLQVRVIGDADFEGKPPLIRRYGPVNVGETVEKALRAKLPKLAATAAEKRLLMLERNQWALDEKQIHDEIESRRSAFPDLAKVNEIWIVETVGAAPDLTRGSIDFRHYMQRSVVENFWFRDGRLASRSKDGMPIPVPPHHH